jgi:hypothetical protein
VCSSKIINVFKDDASVRAVNPYPTFRNLFRSHSSMKSGNPALTSLTLTLLLSPPLLLFSAVERYRTELPRKFVGFCWMRQSERETKRKRFIFYICTGGSKCHSTLISNNYQFYVPMIFFFYLQKWQKRSKRRCQSHFEVDYDWNN